MTAGCEEFFIGILREVGALVAACLTMVEHQRVRPRICEQLYH